MDRVFWLKWFFEGSNVKIKKIKNLRVIDNNQWDIMYTSIAHATYIHKPVNGFFFTQIAVALIYLST